MALVFQKGHVKTFATLTKQECSLCEGKLRPADCKEDCSCGRRIVKLPLKVISSLAKKCTLLQNYKVQKIS